MLRVLLALAVLLQGCSTYFPVNEPLTGSVHTAYRGDRRWSTARSSRLLFVVAFSGGGTRAAAFSYGVLEQLDATRLAFEGRERPLLDEVDHITGVSGGSFTAAYYGLRGRQIFEDFEKRFLTRNVQFSLILQMLWPWNWGLLFSPYFERSDLVARFYDRILFEGATFRDLADGDGPLVQINATDLATGAPFSFIQEQFDFLCSNLLPYRISRAVAASSAVPGPMSPLTLRNFAGQCSFEPPAWIEREVAKGDSFGRAYVNARNLQSYLDSKRRRFIRLVDGGISDNLGVRGPFETALMASPTLSERPDEFGDLRWVVFLLVNAATTPATSWEEADVSPPLISIIEQTATVQINRYSIETIELLRDAYAQWDAVASKWDEPVGFHLIELDFTRVDDPEWRRELNQMPTSLKLSQRQVASLRRAGRQTLALSPGWGALLESLAEAEAGR